MAQKKKSFKKQHKFKVRDIKDEVRKPASYSPALKQAKIQMKHNLAVAKLPGTATFMDNKGNFNKKGYEKAFKSLEALGMIKTSNPIAKNYAEILIKNEAKRLFNKMIQHNPNATITIDRFIASYSNDDLLGMWANTGFSTAELAEQAGVSEAYFIDRKNWFYDKTRGKMRFKISNRWVTFNFKAKYSGGSFYQYD